MIRIICFVLLIIMLFYPMYQIINYLYRKFNLINDNNLIDQHKQLKEKEKQLEENVEEKIKDLQKEQQQL